MYSTWSKLFQKVTITFQIKNKLEAAMDDLEDNLEKEKRERVEQEKAKQKVENELKLARQAADEFDRHQKDLEAIIERKNKEIAALSTKLDQETSEVSRTKKQMKDNAVSVQNWFKVLVCSM